MLEDILVLGGFFRGELPLIHNGNSEVSAHSMRKLLEVMPRFRKERDSKGKETPKPSARTQTVVLRELKNLSYKNFLILGILQKHGCFCNMQCPFPLVVGCRESNSLEKLISMFVSLD